MNLYITFGQVHTHSVNGRTFDKDCVALITADNTAQAFDKVNEYFGVKYAFSYLNVPPADWAIYYPRGIINVEPGWCPSVLKDIQNDG